MQIEMQTPSDRLNDQAALAILRPLLTEIEPLARFVLLRQLCEPATANVFFGLSSDLVKIAEHTLHTTLVGVRTVLLHGVDDPNSVKTLKRGRDYHRPLDVTADQFRHGMAILVTSMVDWLEHICRRRLGQAEARVLGIYFRRVGDQLGIIGLPDCVRDYELLFRSYRQANPIAPNEKSLKLFDAFVELLSHRHHRVAIKTATVLWVGLLERDCCDALRLRQPNRLTCLAIRSFWIARHRILNLRDRHAEPVATAHIGR